VKHFLSFDVEDVYQSFKERGVNGWQKDVSGEKKRIKDILDLLDKFSQKATFFILTEVINDYKEEILEIKAQGHEVASHGHEHLRIWRRSKREFEDDVRKSKDLLEDLISSDVLGYRAPGFSLEKSTIWARDIIQAAGYRYSSSASGIDLMSQNEFLESKNSSWGDVLKEFPATSIRIFGKDARLCGGFYFRALPLSVTKQVFQRNIKKELPVNLYLHPFEFEESPNKLKSPLAIKLMRYYNLEKTKPRLIKLLEEYSFTSFEKTLANPD